MEYVIEAANSDDMRSWLATIRYCMRSTPTVQVQGVEALTAMPNLTTIPASPPPVTTAPPTTTEGECLSFFLRIIYQGFLSSCCELVTNYSKPKRDLNRIASIFFA